MRTALFYGNCQVLALFSLMKNVFTSNGIHPVHVQEVHLLNVYEKAALSDAASRADIFIAQNIMPKPDRPGSDELAKAATDRIRLPNAYFTGYHQHLQLLHTPFGRDTGCLAVWSLVREGLDPDAIQDALLNPNAFQASEILDAAQLSIAELGRRETTDAVDIPLHGFIAERWRKQALFHTTNHPKRPMLLHVCNRLIDILVARGQFSRDTAYLEDGPDLDRIFSSIDFIEHLLLPGVAQLLGIGDGICTTTARIRYRDRFTLAGEGQIHEISIADQARSQRDWLKRSGWEAGVLANDQAASLAPQVTR